eukprot:scaffold1917_cov196-Alexandrium_tamarense.AAC.22
MDNDVPRRGKSLHSPLEDILHSAKPPPIISPPHHTLSPTMSANRAKVLMVGPVNGQLKLLSDKLHSLQKSKAGPFDVCICCGPFFYQTVHTNTTSSDNGGDTSNAEDKLLKDAAVDDGAKLVDGTLTFDVPVLFVDEGDGLPEGVKVLSASSLNEKKKDEDEIDINDDDEVEEESAAKKEEGAESADNEINVPDGLLRIAPNLYQLVGDKSDSKVLDGVADIIGLTLPLKDPEAPAPINPKQQRQHSTSLTVGFLGSKIRLPCTKFEEKSKHTSFLGCDVLISGEWGQGMSSKKVGALTEEDRSAIIGAATTVENDGTNAPSVESTGDIIGSYDVAELVAMSRPRYHLAPGPLVPVQKGGDGEDSTTFSLRNRFVASLPYRYPRTSTTTSGEGQHAGRFLAIGSVVPPAEAKTLGKAFKFIHAVGIVPLAYMDANDREAAMELGSVVNCPYTDESYDVDAAGTSANIGMNANINVGVGTGGLSEAHARRIAQEDAASRMASGGEGAFRWQQRGKKRQRDDDQGGNEEEAKRQAIEEANNENCSLFLHGLHRDPSIALTMDAIMDAFRPFGCVGVRFPKPKMNMGHYGQQASPPSYAFLDFTTHEEASQCLADLKGEAIVRNVMLTLKWSSSPGGANRRMPPNTMQPPFNGGIPPPPPPRRNRLTEAEAADSTTLFLRLPTTDASTFPADLETVRLFAQTTMEDELNIGVPMDSPDRVTAADEPALRVTLRHPNEQTNYGFLEFASHAAALTTMVSLTGFDDGGVVSDDKLAVGVAAEGDSTKKPISHLQGVTLYWAKGSSQPKGDNNANGKNHGLSFNKQHFPPDSRTDCWFCLASPSCEKHLIVAVREECYVAMPKGAVNDFHALIVPVEHGGDGALVNKKVAPEMDDVKSQLRMHAKTVLQKDLFVFERCIQTKGGYHTHIQCIPVEADSGPALQSKMLEMAIRCGFQLKEITSDLGLNALEDDWSGGYFYAEIPLPGGGNEFRRFIYRAGDAGDGNNNCGGRKGTVPLQFGREVLAEVMGNPDIAQWKACVVSQQKEEEMTIAFRNSLKGKTE